MDHAYSYNDSYIEPVKRQRCVNTDQASLGLGPEAGQTRGGWAGLVTGALRQRSVLGPGG